MNLRNPSVRQYLGITEWKDLCNGSSSIYLQNYFQAICQGRLHFKDPSPVRRYYRPITHRIVFKVIHGGEDRINWFRDTFNGRIVYLFRHPIPVSLSREIFPRLDVFLSCQNRRYFTSEQIQYGRKILDSGTNLERGVLSWCLENAVPLKEATDDWAIASYEQMVLDPHTVIKYLTEKLELPKPERMMKRIAIPSGAKGKSDKETQEVLENRTKKRSWLVEKWRREVDAAAERKAMDILECFDLNAYKFGEALPRERFWIKSGPAAPGL